MSESSKVRSHLHNAETNIRYFAQTISAGNAGQNSGQAAYKAISELTQAIELLNKRLDELEARAAAE